MSIQQQTLVEGSATCDYAGCNAAYADVVQGGLSPFQKAIDAGWTQHFPAHTLQVRAEPIGVAYVLCPLHAIKIEGRS